jgi:methylated-DNA-[protein]-cysteine S-methyltransferase
MKEAATGENVLDMASLDSPMGAITVAVRDGRLCALNFVDHWPRQVAWLERRLGPLTFRRSADPAGVVSCLSAYLAGDLAALDSVVVEAHGTPFQRRVWTRLREVRAGTTVSYGELARAIGEPTAVRAVGAANGANPVSIVVPCHRVIGCDGRMVGYGGGLERKLWLLRHEGCAAVSQLPLQPTSRPALPSRGGSYPSF